MILKLFLYKINHCIAVVFAPNFYDSVQSSSLFLAFFFTFMENLFKKHPIPVVKGAVLKHECETKRASVQNTCSFTCPKISTMASARTSTSTENASNCPISVRFFNGRWLIYKEKNRYPITHVMHLLN